MERGRPGGSGGRDVVLALVVAGFIVASAPFGRVGAADLNALGYLLLVASAVVLVARRRAPVAVLVVVTVCVLAYQLRDYPEVAHLPVLVAVYTAVRAGHRSVTLAIAGTALLIGTLAASPVGDETTRDIRERQILIVGWVVAAGVMGEVTRQREAYVLEVEERAADAVRTREETARRRASEERLRIARELHDSLTHSISVIKVQAGVAIHLARKRGDEVPGALVAIEEASRDATRELRATLDVLRTDATTPVAGQEDHEDTVGSADPYDDHTAAASGLALLGELVDRARTTGVPATVTITGHERPLPPDVDRAAYRIVQEALTNVARHAGPAAKATVHLDYSPGHLTVQVDDDGQATPAMSPTPGNGLVGMHERVTGLGGHLRAEPRPGGGFTVRADLPSNDVNRIGGAVP